MSLLAQVVVVVMIGGVALLLGAGAMFFVARHQARRYWRRMRPQLAARVVDTCFSVVGDWRGRVHGTGARSRRQMWTAIKDAEDAVDRAGSLNAPVADLPSGCRTLRRVGTELDHIWQIERRVPSAQHRSDVVGVQLAEVIGAARDVQWAALRACGDATEPHVRSLVGRAREEVEVVVAVLSRMRSIS